MKGKAVVLAGLLVFAAIGLHAADNDIRVSARPALEIPLGPALGDGTAWYSLGGGATIGFEYDVPHVPYLTATATVNADYVPINKAQGDALTSFYLALAAGLRIPILPRLETTLTAGGGITFGMHGEQSGTLPFILAGTGFEFRATPAISLGIGGAYKQSFAAARTLYQGVEVSLGLSYLLGRSGQGARMEFTPTLNTIYPLYYTYYDKHPLGTLRIENRSGAEIQKVRVNFRVPQFMQRPQACGEFDVVRGGSRVDVPLTALFTNSIFEVTEGLKVAAEIVLEYTYVGETVTKTIPVSLTIQNRNAMTWDDDRKAAAFMTTNHPLIKGYAKNLAATIRADKLHAFSNEFRIALGVFTMLQQYGMQYIRDATTPFAVLSEKPEAIDQILFPIESLNYKAGDCDDLAVLYGTLLEAAGIETAFITTPGHIFVAFNLGMQKRQAESLFPDVGDMIERDGKMWIPVEVTLVADGFSKAWQIGAQEWRSASEKNSGALYPAHEAWATYAPAETSLQAALFLPNPREIIPQYQTELNRYIDRRLHELVARITAQIRDAGEKAPLYNRLGVTYAKYGRLDEAEESFQKSIRLQQYAPAYINLGNIAYLRQDPQTAQRMYKRALELQPENPLALLGYVKSSYDLELYSEVNDSLARLQKLDSGAAESVAYMATAGNQSVGRASAAADKELWGWNE